MSIGKFDKFVSIEVATPGAASGYGDPSEETWGEVGKRWASIEDTTGRELVRVRQVDSEVTAVITLREQFEGLTTRHRIRYGTRVFNIRGVTGSSDRTAKRGQVLHAVENMA